MNSTGKADVSGHHLNYLLGSKGESTLDRDSEAVVDLNQVP